MLKLKRILSVLVISGTLLGSVQASEETPDSVLPTDVDTLLRLYDEGLIDRDLFRKLYFQDQERGAVAADQNSIRLFEETELSQDEKRRIQLNRIIRAALKELSTLSR